MSPEEVWLCALVPLDALCDGRGVVQHGANLVLGQQLRKDGV